jgi:small nuclear ribonucleoprotein G
MAKPQQPELGPYLEKRLNLKLNGNRVVTGRLRGFDHFMNIVLDEAVEEVSPAEKHEIGLVVRTGDRRRRGARFCVVAVSGSASEARSMQQRPSSSPRATLSSPLFRRSFEATASHNWNVSIE